MLNIVKAMQREAAMRHCCSPTGLKLQKLNMPTLGGEPQNINTIGMCFSTSETSYLSVLACFLSPGQLPGCLSLQIVQSRWKMNVAMHVVSCHIAWCHLPVLTSFLWANNTHCMDIPHLICSSVDGHRSCFYLFSIVNVMNIPVQVYG